MSSWIITLQLIVNATASPNYPKNILVTLCEILAFFPCADDESNFNFWKLAQESTKRIHDDLKEKNTQKRCCPFLVLLVLKN